MRTLVLVVSLVLSISAHAEHFRGVNWGAPLAKVKSVEEATLLKADGDSLLYKGTLAGRDVDFMYTFLNDRLVEGSYISSTTHTNKNDFISDYNKINDLLTKKYGAPKNDEEVWRNRLYKDEPAQWGFAVSLGHLLYRAFWETESTTIKTILHGKNYKISHVIIYSERASESQLKEQEEKEILDKL